MKSKGGRLTRLLHSISELICYQASKARIRFQDVDSNVIESGDQSLVRRRICAAAGVLLLAKITFMIRAVALRLEPTALDYAIVLGLLAAAVWLSGPRNVSMFWLRAVEATIFLGMSLQLGMQLHDRLRELATANPDSATEMSSNAILFVVAVKDQIIATFGMMMIYGMFIPNTARRAALIVFLMAVAPLVAILFHRSSMDAIENFRQHHVAARGIFSGNILALAVGAGCAIYGTAIMNRWRSRALEAEQLGQYQLHKKIGSGGMGDVYLAEHRLLKRECAVKLIRSDLSDDPVMLSRFEREVQVTATLTHWNTVQVFDYGQTLDGTFFYVMEHLHGRNLRQMVYDFSPMSEPRAIFIIRQVCEALREAAARDLVHRDIKPSNVFLARAGERCDVVKLLDFGLVRPLGSMSDPELSGSNELKGSPRYMCPEQAQGQSPDCRGDIYSLGATAFFILAGRPPFHLQNTLQLVIAHATKEPPTFAEIGVDVSPELERVIQKCLKKKPEDRFQDPDELLAALENIPGGNDWNWAAAEVWWKVNCSSDNNKCNDAESADVIVGKEPSGMSALDDTVIETPAPIHVTQERK